MRVLALMLLVVGSPVFADDWPQWMGPHRDGVWKEADILSEFPSEGAAIDWKVDCGLGYAGPAVVDGHVYLFDYVVADGSVSNNPGQRGALKGRERIRCLNAANGDEVWSTSYECDYSVSYPSGPRCTPTVSENAVVTLGAMGDLTCFDRATGEKQWQVDIPETYDAQIPIWGYASHPLVWTPKTGSPIVITMIGGTDQAVGAFELATGKPVWKGRTSKDAGYCAPVIYETAGPNQSITEQLIAFTPAEVVSLDPATGVDFWSVPIEPDYGMSVNHPQKVGNRLLVTAYGQSRLIKLGDTEPEAKVQWETPGPRSLYTCNSTPFAAGDVAYGCDINSGMFRAISLEDGEIVWETPGPVAPEGHRGRWRTRHATAFITRLGSSNRFILFNDLGELVLCTLTPDGYTEHSRAKVIERTGEAFGRLVSWSHPAYADNAAFVRNDKSLVRVNLAK